MQQQLLVEEQQLKAAKAVRARRGGSADKTHSRAVSHATTHATTDANTHAPSHAAAHVATHSGAQNSSHAADASVAAPSASGRRRPDGASGHALPS
eukprot:137724-Pleurochrysis_carterae.AAC.1